MTDRIEGIVQERGFRQYDCFAVDQWGVWTHIFYRNVQKTGRYNWGNVKPGSRVRYISVSAGKGKYDGLEVEVVEP